MARQTTVRLTDDLDGSDAQTTVRFSWDGVAYEIDLTNEHAAALAAAVRPYLEAARRVGPARGGRRGGTTGGRARAGRAVGEQAVIREWARGHGFQLADRGRIPRRVLDAYQAGQQNGAPSAGSDPAPTTNRPSSAPARKATSKRAAANATPATKATAKKATAKKATAKKATAKKATAKKTSARKAAAKTTATRKVAASKAAPKKVTRRPRATVKAS